MIQAYITNGFMYPQQKVDVYLYIKPNSQDGFVYFFP